MNQEIKLEPQDRVELKVLQTPQIICPKCGSDSYSKKGIICGRQRYGCKECKTHFKINPQSQKLLQESENVISAETLGLNITSFQALGHGDKVNFSSISQEWLKDTAIKFIKYFATNKSFSTIRIYVGTFKVFSVFLSTNNIQIERLEQIDRQIIIDYIEYLNHQNIGHSLKSRRLASMSIFFETVVRNGWGDLKLPLIYKEDYSKEEKPLPRYIPDEVIAQLNQHLDKLPESLMRMILVIQECGLRVSELCQLPLDCLRQDGKGGWFIQFMRSKIKFETTLPVSIELAQVIKEQQNYIKQHLGKYHQHLFCGRESKSEFVPAPKIMSGISFGNHLKQLADKFNICDSTGKRWNFQTHQFRHTVGTRMINNGVPQHIVQRYLGHESPQMTSRYAHIHDSTLRKSIDTYLGTKIVNVNGEVIESVTPDLDNNLELQWLKKKVSAETLSNGYCGLPAQLTCNKGNACLTCGDFLTTIEYLDQHKQHLERTNQVLEVAQTNGWKRQIQINQDVKNSLEKIITTLEVNQDG